MVFRHIHFLNLHNEANYLRRTFLSLEEAARYTRSQGISVELVVVLDRASAATRAWIDGYDFSAFDAFQIIETDNGSLGPSRNDGIRIARGEYIATADGDDLISYNIYLECYEKARSEGPKAIIVQEYYYGFGDNRDHIWRYFGSDKVLNLAFFVYHPYVSRIFAHASLFERVRYADVRLTSGFAYEDWHFNCEAIRAGYNFVVAENTLLFYRLRPGSLMQKALSLSVQQIPHSQYFEPSTFIKTCAADYERLRQEHTPAPSREEIKAAFLGNGICRELVMAAHRPEPTIGVANMAYVIFGSNLEERIDAGAAYFRACEQIGRQRFTDVVLLPFLKVGGSEKYILETLNALADLDPNRRFLVLTGELCEEHSWACKLPKHAMLLDLRALFEGSPLELLDVATLRLIQAVAPGAHVHFKDSPYALRFFRRFGGVLEENRCIFYRFCDPVVKYEGLWVTLGSTFGFLSECGHRIDLIITDTDATREQDVGKLDSLASKYHAVPLVTRARGGENPYRTETSRRNRLLWASRLDGQKRPDLLVEIGRRLALRCPSAIIDVFGSPVLERFDLEHFSGLPNISYKGAYSEFEALPYQDYDAFLYTSAFDGLPNVILEAMSHGLPVIAPDVGGISQVVTPATGFLVGNDPDDETLVEGYMNAICRIYDGTVDLASLREASVRLVEERHSEKAFMRQVALIFGLHTQGERPSHIHANSAERL
ncbi:glycosyltransferase [Microvirga aerilata]|uniref:glycosyltransferase n=1 Tax=Microvirga aerilata TaxID=670292 RepID=UPI003606B34D